MKRIALYSILLVLGICLVYDAHNRWKGNNWKATINADGYGYYAYLPCVFILHHFDYAKIIDQEKQLRPEMATRDVSVCYPANDEGKPVNKYYVGVALLLTPFFLIAYFLSSLLGFDITGYSLPFQLSVSIGALFYLLIGLIFIRKLLKEYSVSEYVIAFVLVAIAIGTNLLYYTVIEPSLSHVYSFSIMAIFFYYSRKALHSFSLKNILLMAGSLAILALIRPVGLMSAAFIPFLAGDYSTLKRFFAQLFSFRIIVPAFILFIAIFGIQMVLWYAQTGHLVYWSYRGERFYFDSPHLLGILFSYRCGLFVYTPITFLALAGMLYVGYRQSIYIILSLLIPFLLITYVLSSWYTWFYGGFGLRAFIDYYGIFAVMLGIFLNSIASKWIKSSLAALVTFLVFVNITQTRQYTNFIINRMYMNKEMYWKIFLKTNSEYVGILELRPPESIKLNPAFHFQSDFEGNAWGNDNSITDTYSVASRHSACIGETANYSPTFKINAGELAQDAQKFAYIHLWAFMNDTVNNASIILSIEAKDGTNYFKHTTLIHKQIRTIGDWQEISETVELPPLKNPDDLIKVYEYSTVGATYIDDVTIDFGTSKQNTPNI